MKLNFTDAEKHILLAIEGLERQKKPITLEGIRDFEGWTTWKKDLLSLNDELEVMIRSGLVTRTENTISLTKEGHAHAKAFEGEGFGKWMIGCELSPSYRKFCQRVFGTDRCHFDMMTQKQFEKLLEVLEIRVEDRVLDLGCGTGSLPETIADLTGAKVVGIDFSANAIEFAQERTREKQDYLSYQLMDMDALSLPPKSFDVVVSIDTLYFVSNLSHTIAAVKDCLQDNGRMGIFYSTHLLAEDPKEKLMPEGTPLAKALRTYDLSFETWEFTTDELGVWERSIQAGDELREEFEAEGNQGILDDRIYEAKIHLPDFEADRVRRYLYHVFPGRK
jgi:SAM-dependent methyltransferase